MTLASQIRGIINKKDAIISTHQGALGAWARRLDKMMSDAVKETLSELDQKDGIILDTPYNLRKINELDAVLTKLNNEQVPKLAAIMNSGFTQLNAANSAYFEAIHKGAAAKLKGALSAANKLMMLKVGISETGHIIKGGWMSSVIDDTSVNRNVKNIIINEILGGGGVRSTNKAVKEYLLGDGISAHERFIKQVVFDAFQQQDAAYSSKVADVLEYNYFVYMGGLIETSRDFCREHNGHVYHRKDAEKWGEWTPSKAEHITEFKQKDLYAVPSYLGYDGYVGIIDRGGYNCRHYLHWIPDDEVKDWEK